VVARKAGGNVVKLWQVADVVDSPQELESLALYNGQRTVLLSVQKSRGENTIAVVDGLQQALKGAADVTPANIRTEVNRDNSRAIRVSVANVKRTLIEGALLTVLIVFLFLNSWPCSAACGHDPQAHGRHAGPPVTLYDKTLGRVTGWFDSLTAICGWSTARTAAAAWPISPRRCANC